MSTLFFMVEVEDVEEDANKEDLRKELETLIQENFKFMRVSVEYEEDL